MANYEEELVLFEEFIDGDDIDDENEEGDSDDPDGIPKIINPNGMDYNEVQTYCMRLKICHSATLGFFQD